MCKARFAPLRIHTSRVRFKSSNDISFCKFFNCSTFFVITTTARDTTTNVNRILSGPSGLWAERVHHSPSNTRRLLGDPPPPPRRVCLRPPPENKQSTKHRKQKWAIGNRYHPATQQTRCDCNLFPKRLKPIIWLDQGREP